MYRVLVPYKRPRYNFEVLAAIQLAESSCFDADRLLTFAFHSPPLVRRLRGEELTALRARYRQQEATGSEGGDADGAQPSACEGEAGDALAAGGEIAGGSDGAVSESDDASVMDEFEILSLDDAHPRGLDVVSAAV